MSIKTYLSHLVSVAVEDVTLSAGVPLARHAGGGRPRRLVVAGDAGSGHQLQIKKIKKYINKYMGLMLLAGSLTLLRHEICSFSGLFLSPQGLITNILQKGTQVLTGFNLGQVFLVVATLVGILRRNCDQVTCSLSTLLLFVCECLLTFLSH